MPPRGNTGGVLRPSPPRGGCSRADSRLLRGVCLPVFSLERALRVRVVGHDIGGISAVVCMQRRVRQLGPAALLPVTPRVWLPVGRRNSVRDVHFTPLTPTRVVYAILGIHTIEISFRVTPIEIRFYGARWVFISCLSQVASKVEEPCCWLAIDVGGWGWREQASEKNTQFAPF